MRNSQNRESVKKTIARIIALVLAVLMVGGAAYSLVYMLIVSTSAADTFPGSALAEDINIRIGLMYGDGVTESFTTTTTTGYNIGVQPISDGVFSYTPFWQIQAKEVTVAAAANLIKSGSDYAPTTQPLGVAVGGFHVEFMTEVPIHNAMFLTQQLTMVNASLASFGLYAFPAYVNGVLRIRVGAFSTVEEASMMYPTIAQFVGFGSFANIVSPTPTGVVVVDPSTDRILFAYDDGGMTTLGLQSISSLEQEARIKTPVGNVYEGVFSYARYTGEGVSGIAVTNVMSLDEYVESVVPYEITNTWPIEVQKAFAIASRSFAAANLRRHEKAYGFDLCNSTHCQAYRGAGRVNDLVREAARSTHGLVITHNGKLVSTYYSASGGGYTVDVHDVWGGDSRPYLPTRATPWEDYENHLNGFWTVELTPYEMYDYIVNTKGYSALAGGTRITSYEVLEYAPGTTHVRKVRITADNGKSVTIETTAKVRDALFQYLNSANFVVGRGSVAYTKEKVSVVGERVMDATKDIQVCGPVSAAGGPKTSEGYVNSTSIVSILTSFQRLATSLFGAQVLTASGYVRADENMMFVLTSANADAYAYGNIEKPNNDPIVIPKTIKDYTVTTETNVATASSPDNFIFVGKGWGHGAGLSQYGAKDLANLGYDYSAIIHAYYTDVSIVLYKELDVFKNQ